MTARPVCAAKETFARLGAYAGSRCGDRRTWRRLVQKIHADVSKVLELPQSREFFQTNSFERVDLTPDQFAQLARNDFKHWGALIKATGVKLD